MMNIVIGHVVENYLVTTLAIDESRRHDRNMTLGWALPLEPNGAIAWP
jgi:hypothetical protein